MLKRWPDLFKDHCILLLTLILLGWLYIYAQFATAGEFRPYYRGARAQAMGDAFVSLADDEQAMFYNPAGLAGYKKYTLTWLNLDLQLSHDMLNSYKDGADTFTNLNTNSFNLFMGQKYSLQATYSAILQLQNFAMAYITDAQYSLRSRNVAYPQPELGYQLTNGFQLSFGKTLFTPRAKRGELRIGAGVKYLNRRGGYKTLSLVNIMNASRSMVSQVMGNYSSGLGVDFGSQFIYHIDQRMRLLAGSSYINIGDVSFSAPAEAIKGSFDVGLGYQYDFRSVRFNLTYDYKHILAQTDWRKKVHIGFETQLPIISLQAGINQVYLTYGASVYLWLLKIQYANYTEEIGSFVNQDPERRHLIKIALKFDF